MDNSGGYLGSTEQPLSVAETPVLLPVRCPTCGAESMTGYPTIVVMTALTRWHNMALYTSCHPASWDASQAEMARIRAFLGEPWIDAHRDVLK
jgi:hypothetical protein